MDKILIITFAKRYGSYIVIAILLFLLLRSCQNPTPEIRYGTINKTKTLIRNHYDTIEKIKVKIKTNTVYVQVKIDSVNKLKTNGLTNYYRERYNVLNEVKSTNLGVAMQDTVARLNIGELVKYDNCVVETKLKDDIISQHLMIQVQKDTIINIVEKQNQLLVKDNKKQKRTVLFYQLALIVTGLLAGAELFKN